MERKLLLTMESRRKYMPKAKFLPGVRTFKLTILAAISKSKNGRKNWKVRCDCGVEKIINAQNLGKTQSCGCVRDEHSRRLGRSHVGRYGNSARNIVMSWYKTHGHSKKHSWEITDEYAEHLLTSPCFYCGSSPDVRKETQSGVFVHGGIDRIDSTKGYVLGNVVPACWLCNCMKNKFSKERFLSHIEKINCFQEGKNMQQVEVR